MQSHIKDKDSSLREKSAKQESFKAKYVVLLPQRTA